MKRLIPILAFMAMVSACNNNASTTTSDVQDSLQDAVVADELAVVHQSFLHLFQYLEGQDTAFSKDKFFVSGESNIEAAPPAPIDEQRLQPFQKYFIYNSDSSLALDLYSYNYIVVTRNGHSSLEEGGPDAEAAVIDFKTKTRKRLFFGGPSYALWDARWTAQNKVLLIGAEVLAENKVIPAIWQFNLRDTAIQVYAYEGEVKADLSAYKKRKLDMGF